MNPADPLTLPLEGISLVEASAGTGKTTALVRTYLRALLTTGLTVDKLLVVTFTRAATGELTTRIRAALAEVHAVLNGEAKPDDFLEELLKQADTGDELLLKRVRAAFTALDDSAVFTIHGFCQRMLADMAFEVGGAFNTEQRGEEQSLREEIAADFWRQRQAGSDPVYARWLLNTFGSPDGLLNSLRMALAVSGELRIEPDSRALATEEIRQSFEVATREAIDAWRKDAEVLRKWLLESGDLKRNIYVPQSTEVVLDEWTAWIESPSPRLPDQFERLTRGKLETGLRKGAVVPDFSFFASDRGGDLQRAAKAMASAWWQDTFAAALGYLRDESRNRKRHAREIGFDDMLQNLHEALDSPGGEILAERIAKRFPLALVDEFQDTDPRQFAIFAHIYKARKGTGLILIGDPKQAIYKFRGADVFTYMRARNECEQSGRIFSLAKNFRTTGALVESINTLFGKSRRPFIYDQIPFVKVESGREIAPLETGGEDAPLTVVWEPSPKNARNSIPNKDEARAAMAGICAEEIKRLLVLGEQDKAHYRVINGDRVAVRARDIAVLVSTHRQGDAVQRALRERKIASVTLTNDSVFETVEAADLEILLNAVAAPASGSRLRRALATPLLGKTAEDIAQLGEDEERWSELVAAFRDYNLRWQAHGFSTMFAQLLREQHVIECTLAREDGERAMTNLRHLAELAETHEAHHPGIESLMAWLARERTMIHRGDETRELRLESDDELVRVVTVHKAKGLEYPVVFLPFLWDAKEFKADGKNPAVLAHDGDLKPVLDLGSRALDDRLTAAAEEHRAERVRLAYVALTRAAHACYLLCTPARGTEHSALAGLLGIQRPLELEEALEKWCAAAPDGAMRMRAPKAAARGLREEGERPHGEAREFTGSERLKQRFYIASYSLLAAGAGGPMAEQPDWDQIVPAAPVVETAAGIHAFPAGATSGTFLHALLESIEFDGEFVEREATVRRLCAEYRFDEWTDTLVPWLAELLATPLDPAGCTLADVGRSQRRDEMEFYFPIAGLEAGSLDAFVSGFAPHGPRPALHFNDVGGQMKGYIDLVFEHGGRFWIVDYKSNRLGSDVSAYTREALDHAMAEHRYDLQYLIYTVALHRYLATRVVRYDYEKHFGGVMYLFLRGMAPGAPLPRGVWHTRPDYVDMQRLDALLGGQGG